MPCLSSFQKPKAKNPSHYNEFLSKSKRDFEEKQGSASFFQREKPEFTPRFFSIFSIETYDIKSLMSINHPFQDLVVNLPCSEERDRTNFLDMINLNQIGNSFRSQVAIDFF